MPRRDPYALRGAALVVTVACAFVAGPELGSRIGAAFDWRHGSAGAAPFRVDGWIDPPLYTRLPPLMIDLAGAQSLRAPVGSTVVIRVAGRGEAELKPGSGLEPIAPKAEGSTAPGGKAEGAASRQPHANEAGLREERFKLTGDASLGISTSRAQPVQLRIAAIPDRPPNVTLSGPPEMTERGSFTLAYRMHDDYGIASAETLFTLPGERGGRRSLVPPPTVALTLPADARTGEETKTLADLSDHPWAGARVRLTIVARDEAGQQGRSAPVEFTLPQRPFTVPLARALVEQRRDLILDPDHREPVQVALDALLIAPELFTPQWGVFLGLRTAATRLREARTDADLTNVADLLWTMALSIEEGDLGGAERELRAAQDRLRQAIDRGASDEEIRKLTDQLKQAMDRYLQEFAQRSERDRKSGEAPARPDRMISQNDLNRMLDQLAQAMKRGDTAEAERLLDQFRSIMENLRTAQSRSRMSDPAAREMNRQMDELDRMAREQQQLRDETFQQGQQGQDVQRGQRSDRGGRQGQRGERGQRGQGQQGQGQQGQGQRGQQGQEGDQGDEEADSGDGGNGQTGSGGLGERQRQLRERLGELQRRMRGLGMQGEQGLSEAEREMGDAENSLGQGRDDRAVDSQGRALEGLRRGMQGMAQQMQQMLGQGDGQDQDADQNGPGNPTGRANGEPRPDDPLGRPLRSRDFSDGRVKVPGANESATERARRILEELRRKLGDPTRPTEELEYFERLLQQPN